MNESKLKTKKQCRTVAGMRKKQKGKGLRKGFLNNKNGINSPKTKSKKETISKEDPILKEVSISDNKIDQVIYQYYEKNKLKNKSSKKDLINLKEYKFKSFKPEEDDDVDNPNSKYKIKIRQENIRQTNKIIYNNNKIKIENNLFSSNKEKVTETKLYKNFKRAFRQKVIETVKNINKYDSNNMPLSEEEIINNAINMVKL